MNTDRAPADPHRVRRRAHGAARAPRGGCARSQPLRLQQHLPVRHQPRGDASRVAANGAGRAERGLPGRAIPVPEVAKGGKKGARAFAASSRTTRGPGAFVEQWRARVAAITHARHRSMLDVILGESLEHQRVFEQAAAQASKTCSASAPAASRARAPCCRPLDGVIGGRGHLLRTLAIYRSRVSSTHVDDPDSPYGSSRSRLANLGDRERHLRDAQPPRRSRFCFTNRRFILLRYRAARRRRAAALPQRGRHPGPPTLSARALLDTPAGLSNRRRTHAALPGAARTVDLDLILYGDPLSKSGT